MVFNSAIVYDIVIIFNNIIVPNISVCDNYISPNFFATCIQYNYTLLFKYMIKCIKHGKLRIICRITLDLKALWMILVSQDDTAYDTDFDMYYSLFITCIYEYYLI